MISQSHAGRARQVQVSAKLWRLAIARDRTPETYQHRRHRQIVAESYGVFTMQSPCNESNFLCKLHHGLLGQACKTALPPTSGMWAEHRGVVRRRCRDIGPRRLLHGPLLPGIPHHSSAKSHFTVARKGVGGSIHASPSAAH